MLDPVEFGKSMAAIVKEATAPLLKRIEQLEARAPEKGDKGDKGDPGRDADPIVLDDVVRELLSSDELMSLVELRVKEEVAKIPAQKDDVVRELLSSDELLSLVELRVKEEVAKIPAPKDGRDGEKGEKGDKGDPGQDGVGVAGAMIDRDGVLIITTSKGETIRLGKVLGENGKDGADFSEVTFDYDGERTLIIRGKGGEITKRLPIPLDRGYWRDGRSAEKGDIFTHGGTAYIAISDTKDTPSMSSPDWRIFARKGRDGKDGRNGIDKTAPVKVG